MTKTIDYTFRIKTANVRYAGTDNDVFITVYGEINGNEVSTGEINLSKRVSGNAFEKGDEHAINFQWEDIGRPTKIKLRLSNDLADDWRFRNCKIKRNGPETMEEDPEINKEVSFEGNDTLFSRKDSHIFYSDLGKLEEKVLSTQTTKIYGGTEFITLPPGSSSTISMTFSEETSNVLEKSEVTENGKTHTLNVGAELSYKAGQTGGMEGKGSISYGFSYSTLETISKKTIDSLTKIYSNSVSVTITNSGDFVPEYTDEQGIIKKTVENNLGKVITYAVVYEASILEVKRVREGASTFTSRIDTLNLGRRVRAILPLSAQPNGILVYINQQGDEYLKDQLWDAVN